MYARESVSGSAAASPGLDITERDVDGVHILSACGELDLAAAGTFCARVDAARDAGCRRLVLDLAQLEFCDSSGLRALIGAGEEIVASGGRFVVIPPTEGPVARLFAASGAHELVPVYSNLRDGQTALARRDHDGPPARSPALLVRDRLPDRT